jgi:hypothetical protein
MALTASEVASLTTALERWEYAEYTFAALVAIGCFGEYVADFTKWWMGGGLWKSLGLIPKRKDALGKFSTLLLIFALTGEWVCLVKTNSLSGLLVGSLSDRSEQAVKQSIAALGNSNTAMTQADSAERRSSGAIDKSSKATEAASTALTVAREARQEADSFERDIVSAKKQATEAEAHLADALKLAASAEAEVAKVRQAAAPRRLTEAQKAELVFKLSATPPFSVSFMPPTNASKEVFDFMDDLTDVFVRMKLISPGRPSGQGTVSLAPSQAKGVVVGVMGLTQFPPAANILLTTLHDWGFDVSSEVTPNLVKSPTDMRILVSSKQ